MNCWEFDNVVMDVARSETRGVPMDAVVKQQALAHAQSCSRCADCLASEQALSQGLRAVAMRDQSLAAPALLENVLLAAFRQQEDAKVPVAVVTPVVAASPLKLFFFRMKWALATAAGLALVAIAVARMMQPAPTQPHVVDNHTTPAPSATVSPAEREKVVPPIAPEPEIKKELAKNDVQPRPFIPVKRQPSRQNGRVTVDVGPFEVDVNEMESLSAKDFLVFDYARTLPPADSTQLMRVRMPRERLAPLGIQIPRAVRNSEYVNADFLVGSDGVPRAIRVVDR